jgi:hypothetical protein
MLREKRVPYHLIKRRSYFQRAITAATALCANQLSDIRQPAARAGERINDGQPCSEMDERDGRAALMHGHTIEAASISVAPERWPK